MKKLNNKQDFEWHCKWLDVEGRYEHSGLPQAYPCIVSSDWWDNPNGPYTYFHKFYYEEEHECSECGHISKKFPITKEQEDALDY